MAIQLPEMLQRANIAGILVGATYTVGRRLLTRANEPAAPLGAADGATDDISLGLKAVVGIVMVVMGLMFYLSSRFTIPMLFAAVAGMNSKPIESFKPFMGFFMFAGGFALGNCLGIGGLGLTRGSPAALILTLPGLGIFLGVRSGVVGALGLAAAEASARSEGEPG